MRPTPSDQGLIRRSQTPALSRGFFLPVCKPRRGIRRWTGLRSWLAPVGKPAWKKPCTSKAKHDCQCCQLHSRQDSCRLACEQRFRQGDQCTCSAKEHHLPLTIWAPRADWLPCSLIANSKHDPEAHLEIASEQLCPLQAESLRQYR